MGHLKVCQRRGRKDRQRNGTQRKERKARDCGNKGRVKRKQRGIPIRETDEGTAEDDSNI